MSLASPAALVDSALAVPLSTNSRSSPMDDGERGALPVSNQGRRWKFSVESDTVLKYKPSIQLRKVLRSGMLRHR